VLIDPKPTLSTKLSALPKIGWFYLRWYPTLWLAFGPRVGRYGALAPALRFAARGARRLARSVFHGMLRYGPKLEKKQAFLFRAVDVAMELLVITCTALRAHAESRQNPSAARLGVRACALSMERVDAALHAMWHNHDDAQYDLAREVLDDRYTWLERGIMNVPYAAEELRPRSIEEYFAGQRGAQQRKQPPTRTSKVAGG
jgi:hypothetical protein